MKNIVKLKNWSLLFPITLIPHFSSHLQVFYKRADLENLGKFIQKHLRWNIFFSKVDGLQCPALLKKTPWHKHFLEFCKNF